MDSLSAENFEEQQMLTVLQTLAAPMKEDNTMQINTVERKLRHRKRDGEILGWPSSQMEVKFRSSFSSLLVF